VGKHGYGDRKRYPQPLIKLNSDIIKQMPVYTRAQLKTRINAGIKGKIGVLVNPNDTCNDVVRAVINEIALRTQKRKAVLAPNLFTDVYQYGAPVDLNNQAIIDLSPQVNRAQFTDWRLTTPEEFDRRKRVEDRLIAVLENDEITKLLVSKRVDDKTLVIDPLNTILTSGGGSWITTGDATNLVSDSDNYIYGGSSLKYDLNSGGVTAGLKNTTLNIFDFTYYLSNSIFHWEYIQDPSGITNFTLRVGNDTSNYYQVVVTSTNEGAAFYQGWNLLRFDFGTATKVGSPVLTTFKYAEFFMTKTVGKASGLGYRANYLAGKRGSIYNLFYYSGYGWQDVNGNWKENSTDDGDFLNCDASEFNLFVCKGVEFAGPECEEMDNADIYGKRYVSLSDSYALQNPNESLILQTKTYDFFDPDVSQGFERPTMN
jgi:hypothetical protein